MGKITNAFTQGLKASNGQAELAEYHNRFNEYLVTNPNTFRQGTEDKQEVAVYENGSTAWVNIALNRKMLDVANVEFFFVDQQGQRVDDSKVPEEILDPIRNGYAGMGFNELIANVIGHEDLCGNALWLKDTSNSRYNQLYNVPGQFIPIVPGNFKIELNSKGTAIDNFTIYWKDGSQQIVTPDKVIQFKRNTMLSPFIGTGLISQGRALVDFEATATQYQINFLQKDGTPDMIYIDKNMANDQAARSKAAQLRSEYRNGKYNKSIMYAYGDVDIRSFSISAADLQYIENRKLNAEQVISLMESTGTVLGLPDANNKASAGVLTNAYFGIVNSRVDHIIEFINKQFVWTVKGNETKKLTISYTPYATGDIDTVQKAVNNGLMTLADGSKAMGLPFDKNNEASNTLYVGAGLRTLQYAFDTKPVDMGSFGLSANTEDVKKKPKYLDYQK